MPVSTKHPIRWTLRRDMAEILAIEKLSYTTPWTDEDFINFLKQKNGVSMVAENAIGITGYMCYNIKKYGYELCNMAVNPADRRKGIAAALISKLKQKLSHPRKTIRAMVRESNLSMLLTLKSLGFLATGIAAGYYEDTGEDGFEMEYQG